MTQSSDEAKKASASIWAKIPIIHKLEAALAEKDAALRLIVTDWGTKEEATIDLLDRLKRTAAKALSPSAGQGWKSPDDVSVFESALKSCRSVDINHPLGVKNQKFDAQLVSNALDLLK